MSGPRAHVDDRRQDALVPLPIGEVLGGHVEVGMSEDEQLLSRACQLADVGHRDVTAHDRSVQDGQRPSLGTGLEGSRGLRGQERPVAAVEDDLERH